MIYSNSFRKIIAIFIVSLLVINMAYANEIKGKKIALIIGIGKYPTGSGWVDLHSDNDVTLLKHTFKNVGFAESNIYTLQNEAATKAGIDTALKNLLNNTSKGDIVVFHFSGHGQQVTDVSGDEADGLDEALVPFDAPLSDKALGGSNYNGSKHLIDDELASWFDRFRKKTGPAGQLIVFIDACHSGTASRGNGTMRGGMPPFIFAKENHNEQSSRSITDGSGYDESPIVNEKQQQGRFIMIAATRAADPDYEYKAKELGSLTYAMPTPLKIN